MHPAETPINPMPAIVQLYRAGRHGEAEQAIDDFLATLAPGQSPPLRLLTLKALLMSNRGERLAAEPILRAALALDPMDRDAYNNLGNLLQERKCYAEAIGLFHKALGLDPKMAEAWNNLALAQMASGQMREAEPSFDHALNLNPDYVSARVNRARLYAASNRQELAEAEIRHARASGPLPADVLLNCAAPLAEYGRFAESLEIYREGMARFPEDSRFRACLSLALANIGQTAESIALSLEVLEQKRDVRYVQNYLYALNSLPESAPGHIAEEHRKWGAALWPTISPPASRPPRAPRPSLPLRVGYVSPDFFSHSVAQFFEPVLRAHDRAVVESYCYEADSRRDGVTQRLQKTAAHWRSIVGLSAADAAQQIYDDGIDILVDLTGHTANNRLDVFAHRPAPIQVSWLGYPNSTGVPAIDYRLTDVIADPYGEADARHTERLVRLDPCFLTHGQLHTMPAIAALPCLASGVVTFGSFNAQSKLVPECLALWARVLHAVPGSRLLLKSTQMRDRSVMERTVAAFAALGIEAARLECRGATPSFEAHIALYGEVDIALDSFPYHGTTTSCEALWMGVPVVSLQGDRHVARVGASLLSAVGLPQLIAHNHEEYVAIATRLAADRPALAQLRASLRPTLMASPLTDAPRFTRGLEAAYQKMAREYGVPL